MRQIAMKKYSTSLTLLAGVFFLLLNPFGATAQIDQDNSNLVTSDPTIFLQCNNTDEEAFTDAIDDIIENFTYTDANNNTCNGNLTYDDHTILTSFPYTCGGGDDVEIEVDIDCDGSIETILVFLTVDDDMIPYDFNNDPDNTLVDPSTDSECNETSTDADIQAWIAEIEANDFGGDQVFGDNCTDNAVLDIEVQNDPTPLDFTTMDGCMTFMIDFLVMDDCGNDETYTFTYEVTDNTDPEFLTIPDVEEECGDPAGTGDPQQDFDDWYDDILNNPMTYAEDDCDTDLVITGNGPFTVDLSSCNSGTVWSQDVEFTVMDECGNEDMITVTYTIEDTEAPVLLANIPDELFECDQANNASDFDNWVNNIINNPASFFEDACADGVDLMVMADITSISPDYNQCNGGFILEEEVTFTVEDPCGNMDDFTAFFRIEDTMAPQINVSSSGNTFACDDFAGIEAELESLLLSGTTDDCSDDPISIDDFIIVEDLSDPSTWNISINGCNGTADFSVEYEDPCGNSSGSVTVTIDLEDTMPPVIISVGGDDPVPSGFTFPLNCDAAPFTPPVVESEDDCGGIVVHDNPLVILPTDCSENLIWEYDDIEDDCGNVLVFTLEGDIEPGQDLVNLRPDIGSGDCNVEFALTVEECDLQSPFCFPDPTTWVNDPNAMPPECDWPFFPVEDVVFEGGCPPYTFLFNPANPTPGPGNVTVTGINGGDDAVFECLDLPYNGVVEWTVIDACGDVLEWSFSIDVLCINCPPGATCSNTGNITLPPCTHCEDANVNDDPTTPCHSCDATILDGFCSCTPPGSSAIDNSQFNNPLCDDGFVPNNMSWFSFTAGATDIELNLSDVECVGGTQGVQTGIYSECEIGNCLASDNFCGTTNDKMFSLSDLIVGELYYIYVDGCAGAGCTFLISIDGQVAFVLDEPIEVTVESMCDGLLNDPCGSDDPVSVCPGQEIMLQVTHDDSSPTEPLPPFGDDCETYDPQMDAEYIWTISPALNDLTMGMIGGPGDLLSFFTPEDGYQFPPIAPQDPGTFEICLEQVVTQCDVTQDRACVILNVTPPPPERAEFRVCRRDLTAFPDGWDPNRQNDWITFGAPAVSGELEWQGGNITLDEATGILTAANAGPGEIFDADGCFTYVATDPCGCLIDQTICITVAGTSCADAEIVDMYMFECQFVEFDDDEIDDTEYMQYCWLWDMANNPDIENPKLDSFLVGNTCILIEMNSLEFGNWGDQDFCDTIVKPNIMIAPIDGMITPGDCTAAGTPWTFELCTEPGDCYDDDWPTIATDEIVWVDCDSGDPIFVGATYVATSDQEICVKATYSFNDGAWGGDNPFSNFGVVPTACDWIFGRYQVTSATATSPVVDGGRSFCETDLIGHVYTIPNAVPGDVYNWSGPAGTVITPSTGSTVTVDFPTGMSTVTLLVDAVTSCGPASGQILVTFTESPSATIAAVPATCLGDNVTLTATTTGGTGPYTYLWNPAAPDGPTATYPTTLPGTTDVTVLVTDANGCESLIAPGSFDVGEAIDATVISCMDITASTVGFCWEEVPGATGYNVTWTGAATGSLVAGVGELCIPTITGLGINEAVTITVTPLGDGPCGDGPPMDRTCTTDNCPDPDFVFAPRALTYCDESPIDAFSYQDSITINDGGNLVFTDPSGAISTTGDFDPSGLAPGTYQTTTQYFYNNNQCDRPGPTITIVIEPTPSAAFTLDPVVCIDEIADLDATNITGSAVYDFDDPSGTVSLANLSWETPGDKTVVVNVTSAAGCVSTSQAVITVQDTLQPIVFNMCDTDINFVHFDWEDVVGATGYDLSWTSNMGTTGTANVTISEFRDLNGLAQNETVTLTVTAIAGAGFCRDISASMECTAGACDFLAAPEPTCVDEGADSVTFEWDPVMDINGTVVTDYIVVQGSNQTPVTGTSITITSTVAGDDLCPSTEVIITVISVNPDPLCPDSNESRPAICNTLPCPDFDVNCDTSVIPPGSTTTVGFMWDELPGATEYQLTYIVTDMDGNADAPVELPAQLPGNNTWSADIFGPGQSVQLIVGQVFGTCDPCVQMRSCPVGECPDLNFSDPEQTECWDGMDPISLIQPSITDDDGNEFTGTFTWDDTRVESNGDFRPTDTETSQTYNINYNFIEAASLCPFPGSVTVTVNIRPTPIIDPIPALCVGSTASITSNSFEAGATVTWTFEMGDPPTATGEGPIDVTYNEVGVFSVSLNVESAPGCDMDAIVQMVQVDRELEPFSFQDCGFTNTSASWAWNDIADEYLVTIINTVTGDIVQPWDANSLDVPEVSVDNLDSDVEYRIEVEAISPNTCPNITGTAVCTPSSCPIAPFDPAATYSFGGFCPGDGGEISLAASGLLQGGPSDGIDNETWTAQNADYQVALDASGNFNTGVITTLPATILVDYRVVFLGEGCSYDTTFAIVLHDEPFINELIAQPIDCIDEVSPSFEIFAGGGAEPYSFEIARDDPPGDVQTGSVYAVPSPGMYNVTVTDANGCTDERGITIAEAENPVAEVGGVETGVIFNEETGTFDAIVTGTNAPITEVQWFVNDSLLVLDADQNIVDVIASIEELGTSFEIRIVVFFGPDCFVESETRVIDIIDTERIYIPNAISPKAAENGNDRWKMFTKGSVVVQEYSLYDRWGELIFVKELDPVLDATRLTGPDETATVWDLGWEGEWGRPDDNQGEAIQGVYVYVIKLTIDGIEEIEAGDLTIFR